MTHAGVAPFYPRIRYSADLPAPKSYGASAVLIYDRALAARIPRFKAWSSGFAITLPVKAGEPLKELRGFSSVVEKLIREVDRKGLASNELTIVALGGGSVGDFSGFLASVLKRGVRFVNIPSTWLSALDSAHGGKTALNAAGIKNQIGTFYPATQVELVKTLLLAQPEARSHEAFGELAKVALIDSKFYRQIRNQKFNHAHLLWKALPGAIEAKYRVVMKDPYEKRQIRQILNLGHTVGHVLEAEHGLPHGVAVAQGMVFALEWSVRKRLLKSDDANALREWLNNGFGIRRMFLRPVPRAAFQRLLSQDKKRSSRSHLRFVFLRDIGKPELRSVPIAELLSEAKRQGWVK